MLPGRSGPGMDDFTVDLSSLAGFDLDLQDLGTTFSSNASRLLSGVHLPAGSTGLMADLAPSFDKFQSVVSAAQQADWSAIGALCANLATAATKYQATDDTFATAISATSTNLLGESGTAGTAGGREGVSRFGALQLPSLPEVPENQYMILQVVSASVDLISNYDDRLSEAVGVRPTSAYLSPLVADWEALQAIGKRIDLLGINDYVTSENLGNGIRWLQSKWSGDASQAFSASVTTLGQSMAGRSTDLEIVAKIVQNAGECLERLVYNQAIGLTAGILQPMTYFGITFPLGIWAPYMNQPIRETIRSEIAAAVEALKRSAESRQNAVVAIVEKISRTLEYSPGRTAPAFNVSEFEIPNRVVVDVGSVRYGFGDNIWWEESIDSAIRLATSD